MINSAVIYVLFNPLPPAKLVLPSPVVVPLPPVIFAVMPIAVSCAEENFQCCILGDSHLLDEVVAAQRPVGRGQFRPANRVKTIPYKNFAGLPIELLGEVFVKA